ncbi:MAG: permease [bacterium]
MIINFFSVFLKYFIDILPSLILGFTLSGIIHEFVPQNLINKYLTGRGIKPILLITIIGMILPLCCFGVLPVALGFRKKGVPLGPILAFIVATPATSLTAILVTWRLLGPLVTLYLCLSVILMGLVIGIIGNALPFKPVDTATEGCPMCNECSDVEKHQHHKKGIKSRIISIITFGFVDVLKDLWRELLIGIILAAAVASITPLGDIVKQYFTGWQAYLYILIFGLLSYVCSTASVPLVHALVSKGLSIGAGLVFLISGPVTSYGTMLVIKKEFGWRVLIIFLLVISIISLILGYLFTLIAPPDFCSKLPAVFNGQQCH